MSEGAGLLVDHPELLSKKIQSSTCIIFSKNTGESRGRKKNVCVHGLFGYLSFLVPEGNWGNKFLKTFQKPKKYDKHVGLQESKVHEVSSTIKDR